MRTEQLQYLRREILAVSRLCDFWIGLISLLAARINCGIHFSHEGEKGRHLDENAKVAAPDHVGYRILITMKRWRDTWRISLDKTRIGCLKGCQEAAPEQRSTEIDRSCRARLTLSPN